MHNARDPNAIARRATNTRAQAIASVIERLPEHLQPSKGSFEDVFSRACTEIALSAGVDESGVATVQPGALLYLARLLCGRSLPTGDCHDACRLQHQCIGSTKLVLASFGSQARACIEALGLRIEPEQAPSQGAIVRKSVQPLLRNLRKVGSAA